MSAKATILLTGATGFLGSHLLEALLAKYYSVVVLKRSTSNLWRIEHLAGKYKSYDVDTQSLEQAFKNQQIDCVIHTACHYGRNADSVSNIVESNLMFGLRLLDAAIKYNTKTFINTDTFLPRELNTYSMSKKQLVDWLSIQSAKIRVINLKLEHMYGPRDDATKFMAWFISQLKQNKRDINLTSGIQKRDFIFIDDVVSAFLYALKNFESLENFNEFEVGTGKSIHVRTFVQCIKEEFEKLNGNSKTQLNFGAVPYRQGEIMEFNVHNQALRQLGWQPKISLLQGIRESLKENI